MVVHQEMALERLQRRQELNRLRLNLERAERAVKNLQDLRRLAIMTHHGDRQAGYLSYSEIATALGISKNRVTQLVPPAKDRL